MKVWNLPCQDLQGCRAVIPRDITPRALFSIRLAFSALWLSAFCRYRNRQREAQVLICYVLLDVLNLYLVERSKEPLYITLGCITPSHHH